MSQLNAMDGAPALTMQAEVQVDFGSTKLSSFETGLSEMAAQLRHSRIHSPSASRRESPSPSPQGSARGCHQSLSVDQSHSVIEEQDHEPEMDEQERLAMEAEIAALEKERDMHRQKCIELADGLMEMESIAANSVPGSRAQSIAADSVPGSRRGSTCSLHRGVPAAEPMSAQSAMAAALQTERDTLRAESLRLDSRLSALQEAENGRLSSQPPLSARSEHAWDALGQLKEKLSTPNVDIREVLNSSTAVDLLQNLQGLMTPQQQEADSSSKVGPQPENIFRDHEVAEQERRLAHQLNDLHNDLKHLQLQQLQQQQKDERSCEQGFHPQSQLPPDLEQRMAQLQEQEQLLLRLKQEQQQQQWVLQQQDSMGPVHSMCSIGSAGSNGAKGYPETTEQQLQQSATHSRRPSMQSEVSENLAGMSHLKVDAKSIPGQPSLSGMGSASTMSSLHQDGQVSSSTLSSYDQLQAPPQSFPNYVDPEKQHDDFRKQQLMLLQQQEEMLQMFQKAQHMMKPEEQMELLQRQEQLLTQLQKQQEQQQMLQQQARSNNSSRRPSFSGASQSGVEVHQVSRRPSVSGSPRSPPPLPPRLPVQQLSPRQHQQLHPPPPQQIDELVQQEQKQLPQEPRSPSYHGQQKQWQLQEQNFEEEKKKKQHEEQKRYLQQRLQHQNRCLDVQEKDLDQLLPFSPPRTSPRLPPTQIPTPQRQPRQPHKTMQSSAPAPPRAGAAGSRAGSKSKSREGSKSRAKPSSAPGSRRPSIGPGPSTNDPESELIDKLRNAKSNHEEWRKQMNKLEANLAEVNRDVSELKTKADELEKAQTSDPEGEQLANSLQILTCLKDVMMPYQSRLLPKDPNAMTREQKIVYHFLNEVQAATARQTPQVEAREPREPRVWRP
eukprot:gnl/MRDRNA2_/MRDRNA2_100036_c0_seq1.p1 gnl/MRDRNA2_/MRDRNA2_100036_c0~~gnl/MRDRNA2_/MRDRNA2_100036_c0_seq1.p1  ORF type:complete len:890 (-),score=236.96 gnl/MRDRNA2_/MRDRNA2_100036_c0_seq1:161-2830(-)